MILMTLINILVYIGIITWDNSLQSIIPFNIYMESDPLLNTYLPPDRTSLCMISGSYAWHTRGFLAGCDDGIIKAPDSQGNVLQLWQKQQNGIAALDGLAPEKIPSQYAQALFRDGNNLTHGIFTPYAHMSIPTTLLCAFRTMIPHNFIFSAYVPYRVVRLSHVCWSEKNPAQTFEQITTPPLIQLIETLGDIDLTNGWTRHGFGDLIMRIERYSSFPQMREWLRLVNIQARAGMLFPTGLKADLHKLLALPFGFDQGPGFVAGGRLELCYPHGMVLGIDGELTHLFGNVTHRRIKTTEQQTDLLLIEQACVGTNPGFVQSFTLFLEKVATRGGLSGRLGYYYTKQTEDTLYPYIGSFNTVTINNAENIQDWTAHALTGTITYDWSHRTDLPLAPAISSFLSYGFNGKRAILANSFGIMMSMRF